MDDKFTLVKQLRLQAADTSEASRKLEAIKQDYYVAQLPEETLEWKAADEIERLTALINNSNGVDIKTTTAELSFGDKVTFIWGDPLVGTGLGHRETSISSPKKMRYERYNYFFTLFLECFY